jgi:small multidrug resistance pump
MKWFWLVLSITCEILGTTSLKLSSEDGPHAWKYGIGVVVLYTLCFAFLAQCMKHFSLGTLYATWSGLGVALVAIIGVIFFGDNTNALKVISFLLLIAGVVGLNLSGISH